MSSIEKILIRGIRSFEAESGDAATITFYSPLTLITGHNGSGKTTIIECLKYATTGDLPPGSKGGAFVNDPKMSGSPSIKAQVRLRFKNVNNQTMSVVRSLSVTVKKTSYTQKTLENVLSAVDPATGELVSLSSKCAEIDSDVPNHLGVSRAILDNVIFCHQEESNWPLSEPSILKKKFDEIFASTKYTNVLDSIKAIRKEKAVELKILSQSLDHLRRNKEKAERVRQALSTNIENTEKNQQKVDQFALEIDKCAEEISKLMAKTREIQAMEATLNALSHEHKSVLANIRELEGTFTLYSESDADLQEMLFKHDLSFKTADQEKSKQERLKQKATSAIANLQASVNQSQQTIGQLKALLESNKRKQGDRDLLVSELASLYKFEGFDSLPLLVADVQRFVNKLEIHVQQKVSEVDQLKSEIRGKEQEIRSELSDKKARMDMSSSLKAKLREAISSAQGKLRQQNMELAKYQTTESEIVSTAQLLQQQEEALQGLRSSDPGLESLESRKRFKMADVEAFENELSRLSEQSAAQIKNAGSQARLTLLKSKHSERAGQIQSLMQQHGDSFSTAIKGIVAPEMLAQSLVPLVKAAEATVTSSMDALEGCKRQLSNQDARIESIKTMIQKHGKTIEDCTKRVSAECGSESFPYLLASKEEALAETREQVQDMKAMSTMYSRFVAMAEKKHGCPLCSRGFDPTLEAQFTAKLRRLMEKAEDGDDDEQLASLEASVLSLRALTSVWDNAEQLRTVEIPALEQQLSEWEAKKLAIVKALDAADMESSSATLDLDNLRKLSVVAKSILDLNQENENDSATLKALETELLCSGSTHSAEELQAEYNAVKEKIQGARQELNGLNQAISQSVSEIQRKEQTIRALKDKLNQLQNQSQRKTQIKAQIAEIEASEVELQREAEQHELESQNVMPEMNWLNELLRQVTAEGHAKEITAQQVVSELQRNLGKVQMYNKDIERVDTKVTMTELSKLEAATDAQIDEIQAHTQEIREADQEVQGIQAQLSEFKNLQRNIDDNLRYRRHKAKAQELDAQIKSLSSQRDVETEGTYNRQLHRLSKRQSELSAERAGLQGELRQMQDQKRQYEDELATDYKDVVQKYHENLINYKTNELASSDLEKYAKALQSAIVDYHTLKIEEINKSIKELWTNTYRGTDIDTIEIRSDQEGLRANQSYNYRVVMLQRGRALDMRGRCSAGQKVLASIIIRLALAESFSISCGILALDEPTTNLDHENVAQLAQSLKSIIEKHRQQSNFQLIIITHDEEFLKMISLSNYTDYFYRVLKNKEQYSTIKKLSINDM